MLEENGKQVRRDGSSSSRHRTDVEQGVQYSGLDGAEMTKDTNDGLMSTNHICVQSLPHFSFLLFLLSS